MSTKSTIKYGDNFHFYNEGFEDGHVYLDLDNGMWEAASDGSVTVAIPLAVWAIIRESAPVELPYAEKTDAEIEAHVTGVVDKRIEEYNNAEDEKWKAWLNFIGCLSYGGASEPRDTQIKSGMEYFKKQREKQAKILKQINAYKEDNKDE